MRDRRTVNQGDTSKQAMETAMQIDEWQKNTDIQTQKKRIRKYFKMADKTD